jgi:hypothetical protein
MHTQTTAIESELIVVHSDTTAIEAAGGALTAAQASDLAAIESELIVVHSDTTAIESELIVVHSDTTAMHTQTTAIESELILVHSETTVIVSDTTAMHTQTTAIESELIVVHSETTAIQGDTQTDGVAIATATAQAIGDEILKRGVSNVEDTADALSIAAIILATLESSISGTTWTIRKSGGTTFTTKTVTVDSDANPITGVT